MLWPPRRTPQKQTAPAHFKGFWPAPPHPAPSSLARRPRLANPQLLLLLPRGRSCSAAHSRAALESSSYLCAPPAATAGKLRKP